MRRAQGKRVSAVARLLGLARSPRVGGDRLSLRGQFGLTFDTAVGFDGRPSGETEFINIICLLAVDWEAFGKPAGIKWRAELI